MGQFTLDVSRKKAAMTVRDIDTNELWDEFRQSENAFYGARTRLLAHRRDLHSILSEALADPAQRGTALRVIETLAEPGRRAYLAELTNLAAVSHSDLALVRRLILSLDREWLVGELWPLIRANLNAAATDEEYRRYAELLRSVDPGLLRKLVDAALKSDDTDIREVGADFRKYARTPATITARKPSPSRDSKPVSPGKRARSG